MSDVVVSVIISTYNRVEALNKAISSVLLQTITNIEVIVCDDGSTDNTETMVNELIRHDKRIKYLNCGHHGRPAIPRNKGIDEAKGEWLAFLDDDDIWFPEKIEKQIQVLRRTSKLACCTNAYIIDNETNTKKLYFENTKDKIYSYKDFIRVNPVICSSMMIHKSLIPMCCGFPENDELKAIEDYALWHRVCGFTDIVYLSSPLVGYTMCNLTSIRLKEKTSFAQQKELIMNDFSIWLKEQSKATKMKYCWEQIRSEMYYYPRLILRKIKNRR